MNYLVAEISNNRIISCLPFDDKEDAQERFDFLKRQYKITNDLTYDEEQNKNIFTFDGGSVMLYSLYQ